jgi:hypothetical protein
MAKKQQKQAGDDGKAERLRALRLAHEATRREAGIWGEMTVGEILHQASRSVFMQVWKGQRRPDPFEEGGARRAGASAVEWAAILEWIGERNSPDFSQRIVAWDLNAVEARKILQARIAEHEAAGYAVTNPLALAKMQVAK